ncbi:MAG TPA: bifunctional oligoribonuclease/PAP phosphatase NrnA [Firmicutes bacterium]|nr:bifunctional oligoribonuclease/PAP phosphatase NrnA [Bacillota bacterium]
MPGLHDISHILRAVYNNGSFLIFTHEMPDGDTIGSSLALAGALKQLGKRALVVSCDPVPVAYRFLHGADEVKYPSEINQEQHGTYCAILVDCGEPSRVKDGIRLLDGAALVINIDHHVSNTMYGDITWVEPDASSVGEMMYTLLTALGARITPELATALFTAIFTDTGSFRYTNTTAHALLVASRLVEFGANPNEVSEHVYETKSISSLRLLARALDNLKVDPSGKVAWLTLTKEDMKAAGASEEESEGLVSYARMVRGAEVGILFRETENGSVKVGLRSRKWVDVAALAKEFGGGGHPRASGCTIKGEPIDSVVSKVLNRVLQVMESAKG